MHTKRSLLAALAAGALIAVCWLLPSSRDAAAGTALRLDLQGLIDRAGLIVEGRVLSKEAREGPGGIIETEYLLDIAVLGREHGLRSVLISCGFMNEYPLAEMCEKLDAIKIDLKGYSREFYRKVCDAELDPVLRSIKQVAKSNTHLEIVNLVVPTLNDSDEMLTGLADWVAGEIGPDVPVHFTRFHPDYRMLNLPPTPVATLERARDIAVDKGIHYAFVGNVPGHSGNQTYCPKCGKVVIERRGFFVRHKNLVDGKCKFCGEPIAGVWS